MMTAHPTKHDANPRESETNTGIMILYDPQRKRDLGDKGATYDGMFEAIFKEGQRWIDADDILHAINKREVFAEYAECFDAHEDESELWRTYKSYVGFLSRFRETKLEPLGWWETLLDWHSEFANNSAFAELMRKAAVILPVYLHPLLNYLEIEKKSSLDFVGVIYCTYEKGQKKYPNNPKFREKIERDLRKEIEMYSQWLQVQS